MTCNISVSVMPILFSLPFMFIYLLCMKKVYSIQLWYYLYSRILRTFVNISSAKEEKVRRSFFRKDLLYFSFKLLSLFFFRTFSVEDLQGLFSWTRPISFIFSYHPFHAFQEQSLVTASCEWRKEFDSYYVYSPSIYAIMNPEFINSLEHNSVVVMSHTTLWIFAQKLR